MSFLAPLISPSVPKVQPLPAAPSIAQPDIQAAQATQRQLAADASNSTNNILTDQTTQKASSNIQYHTLLGD